MATQKAHWDKIRRNAISPDRPDDWPPDVAAISLNGLGLLGINRKTRKLYWDGEELVTVKRFSTFERWLAVVGLVFAGIGVAATVVQAWAAVTMLPPPG